LRYRDPGQRVGSDRREGQGGAAESARTALFRRPVTLELHAEPIGDPVDVVVVGDDLVGVDDRAVLEAVRAQPVEIFLEDLGGSERQLAGVLEERREPRRELVVVAGDDRLRQRSVT